MEWRPVLDPRSLGEARHQAHNAVQWLARISNSYVEPKDKRLTLRWQRQRSAVETRPFAHGLRVELRFPQLVMQFTEQNRPVVHELDVEGRSPAEVEAWVLVELLHRGIDRDLFSTRLPYEIPDLLTGDEPHYSPQACMAELNELCAWFENAARALELLRQEFDKTPGIKSEVDCWPQNLHLTNIMHNGASFVGLGFSPGDHKYPEPYFYVSRSSSDRIDDQVPSSILEASQFGGKNLIDELRKFFSSALPSH